MCVVSALSLILPFTNLAWAKAFAAAALALRLKTWVKGSLSLKVNER